MNKNEYLTLQERLDALEYETGSRMDMFDSAIRNAGGFDQPEEVTFTDKLKQAGKWIANHKEEILLASVTAVTGAIIYALYKSQKQETQETPPEVIKLIPVTHRIAMDDRWALAAHKYDDEGNEITLNEIVEQLINEDFKQVDDTLMVVEGEKNNE